MNTKGSKDSDTGEMSSIIGILYKTEKRISNRQFDDLLNSIGYWKPDNQYKWSNNDIFLGNLLFNTTPQSLSEYKPIFHAESHCVVIADSRLDYRRELINEMGLSWDEFQDYPDNYLILKAYVKWGEECVKHIYGDFAFAIWNDNKKQLFCARDHFGIRPLYYCDHEDFFILSTDIIAFKEITGENYQIREEFIIDSICTIIPQKHLSAYDGIYKLEPAHSMKLTANGSILKSKFWDLRINEEYSELDEENAKIGLRDIFMDSIQSKINSNVKMGLELSGGLDSSSIAACLSQLAGGFKHPISTYTHSMSPEQEVRPRAYTDAFGLCQDIFSSSSALQLNSITGKENLGCVDAVVDYLEINMKPVLQSFAMMSDNLYSHAKEDGVKILFSGYGGDQGATQSGAFYFTELANEKKWDVLKDELKLESERSGSNYLKLFIKYYLKTYAPIIFKLKRKFTVPKGYNYERLKRVAVEKSFENKRNILKRYHETTKRLDIGTLRQQQYHKFASGFMSERLESSYYLARKRKIEYRYPFLDVKLIEFFYSLKSEYKYKDGIKRYLFRMAMEGILDDRIRMIPEKVGSAIPNELQRLLEDENNLKEIVYDCRANNTFHYVDYKRLLHMIDQLKDSKIRKKIYLPPLVFFTSISVLVLQKWQRERKIDIGIKC